MSDIPVSGPILLEREGAVAIVTLNRPEALNALSRGLRKALKETFAQINVDPDVRAVVLTGAGHAFTAGIDLKEAGQSGFSDGSDNRSIDFVPEISACPWPIICAVNGFAITGGFELVLMCDVIYASTNAKFGDTHARVGVMPGWGLSQRLSRLIGISRAKEVSLSGNFLDAETAERWGLVNRVFAPDELVPAAKKLAKDMASNPPGMLKGYKRMIDEGFGMDFADALKRERQVSAEHAKTVTAAGVEEARKAVQARGREQKG